MCAFCWSLVGKLSLKAIARRMEVSAVFLLSGSCVVCLLKYKVKTFGLVSSSITGMLCKLCSGMGDLLECNFIVCLACSLLLFSEFVFPRWILWYNL